LAIMNSLASGGILSLIGATVADIEWSLVQSKPQFPFVGSIERIENFDESNGQTNQFKIWCRDGENSTTNRQYWSIDCSPPNCWSLVIISIQIWQVHLHQYLGSRAGNKTLAQTLDVFQCKSNKHIAFSKIDSLDLKPEICEVFELKPREIVGAASARVWTQTVSSRKQKYGCL
jgi:hypothetical protein